jgi:hypothetical protein
MPAAACAQNFDAFHPERIVGFFYRTAFVFLFEETGPTALARKFGVRPEQFIAAGCAVISTFSFKIPVFACKGAFGLGVSRNFVDILGQHFFPLLVGQVEFFRVGI